MLKQRYRSINVVIPEPDRTVSIDMRKLKQEKLTAMIRQTVHQKYISKQHDEGRPYINNKMSLQIEALIETTAELLSHVENITS